jgi:hypothetical protein
MDASLVFQSAAALAVAGLMLGRLLLLVLFTILAGVIQGRSTGTYPKVNEWSGALKKLLTRAPPKPHSARVAQKMRFV